MLKDLNEPEIRFGQLGIKPNIVQMAWIGLRLGFAGWNCGF